jgi:hypothetical protein
VTVSAVTFPLQVNVGAAGAQNSGAAGGAGGTSSVIDNNGGGATLCSAGGGAGGAIVTAASAAGTFASPGDGALASMVGDVQVKGQPGGRCYKLAAAGPVLAGFGGISALGGGAMESVSTNHAGPNGGQYGGGGAGSARGPSLAALFGGAGAAGVVIIIAIY